MIRLFHLSFAIGLLLLDSSASAQMCHYTTLEPYLNKATAGNVSFDFGEEDNANNSQAWQGPLVINQNNGSSCTVSSDVSVLERPFYQDGKNLLVTTYSGSNKKIFIIDIAACRVLWRSRPFTGEVSMTRDVLQLGKEKVGFDTNCIPIK